MTLPLEGVRVCDLTIIIAGPTCTALLGELGAEVIKIEEINARLGGDGGNAQFQKLNRGKKGISLNLKRPEAREAFLRLIKVSDVVVENFSPRVMPSFGLGYEDLKAVKPDIVMVSMPALGSTGPLSNRLSYGPGIDAMSGMEHVTGFQDGPPTKPGAIMGDYNAAMMATFSVMMGLYARQRTGKGQHIEVAMREGQTFLIGDYIVDAAMNHRSPTRTGNRHSSMAPHNIYPCRGEEEWVAIAVGDDNEWQQLQNVLEDPEWMRDPRFQDAIGRYQHQEEIDHYLAQWTRPKTAHEVMTRLQDAGIASGVVMNARHTAEDPHFNARGVFRKVELSNGDAVHVSRPGYVLTRSPGQVRPSPGFAEHTDYVFSELLGYTAEEIGHLEEVRATSRVPIRLVEE